MNFLSPQWALVLGFALSQILPHAPSLQNRYKKLSSQILKLSVILLGASLNFKVLISQGAEGLLISFLSLFFVFSIAHIFNMIFKLEQTQGLLITAGTGICGGSAIAALAPVLKASSLSLAVSMGVVFLLNAVSVFVFPYVGELLNLSQMQFGVWSALAIHDTSSVVASASIYGEEALKIGASLKLTRSLWILPLILLFSFLKKETTPTPHKAPLPWFILGFVLLSLLFTFVNFDPSLKEAFTKMAKTGFSLTLFLIGLTFNRKTLKAVGFKPFLFGLCLWITTACTSLLFIKNFY